MEAILGARVMPFFTFVCASFVSIVIIGYDNILGRSNSIDVVVLKL
jgi:hypothetical protein